MIMFCDQMSCILGNTSTIEKLQKKRAQKQGGNQEERSTQRSSWQNLCEVMNGNYREGFSLRWIWPTDIEHTMFLENEY
jgi:hypothetical protein